METDLFLKITEDYEKNCRHFEEFILSIKNLIKELLSQYDIQYFTIQDRLKDISSLQEKISRKEYKYNELKDITDICGIRIITYFSDDVNSVASMITKEFAIDDENSIDKRALLEPDRFGYLSLQYVAKLSDNRLKLTEYHHFSDCQIEIQIQSLLQHAWSEIQHDLGYKSEISVPREIVRRFSQLAGLLELTDDEFVRLRNALLEYKRSLPDRIRDNPQGVPIDQSSLLTYVQTSNVLKNLEKRIESERNIELKKEDGHLTDEIERLTYVGYISIYDIDSAMIKLQDLILKITRYLIADHSDEDKGGFSSGLSLFYLPYAQIAVDGSMENIIKSLDKFWGVDTSKTFKIEFAKELLRLQKEHD